MVDMRIIKKAFYCFELSVRGLYTHSELDTLLSNVVLIAVEVLPLFVVAICCQFFLECFLPCNVMCWEVNLFFELFSLGSHKKGGFKSAILPELLR